MRVVTALFCLLMLTLSPQLYSAEGKNQELQGLIDELKQLTTKARQQRAADRWLLNDLEELAGRFDWPWRNELLLESFADGDYTRNPQWEVYSGQFWIDGRLGLRSQSQPASAAESSTPQRQPKQDIGSALLGALLQEALRDDRNDAQPEPTRQPTSMEPAEIQLQIGIPLAFASKVEFSAHNRPSTEAQIEFGVIQDQRGSSGYRVAINLGQRPSLELISMLNGRTRVLNATSIDNVGDGQSHALEWRREANGQMEVLLDGKSLLQAQDRSFRYPFKRFAITNRGGDFAISSASLYGGE